MKIQSWEKVAEMKVQLLQMQETIDSIRKRDSRLYEISCFSTALYHLEEVISALTRAVEGG